MIDAGRKKAKARAGVKAKDPSAEQEEKIFEAYEPLLVVASTVGWTLKAKKQHFDEISYKQVCDLRGGLPRGEWPKLTRAIYELSLKDQIAHSAVSTPDFS